MPQYLSLCSERAQSVLHTVSLLNMGQRYNTICNMLQRHHDGLKYDYWSAARGIFLPEACVWTIIDGITAVFPLLFYRTDGFHAALNR